MASEEVIEEVEALTAILEEDTVEVVKEEGGERPKVEQKSVKKRNLMMKLKLYPQELSIKILPLTEGEQEKQYVSLNLVVSLPEGSTNYKSKHQDGIHLSSVLSKFCFPCMT